MREIKFRVWDISEGQMFYGVTNVKVLNLMQYTGLKDVTGREIYEGDVCKNLLGIKGEIVYYGYKYMLKNKEGMYRICELPEVIGNIYENSDLLK